MVYFCFNHITIFQMICQKLWHISVRVGITRSKVIFIITIDITIMISNMIESDTLFHMEFSDIPLFP